MAQSLYVIGNEEYGWYKIGIAESPEGRIHLLQTGCPVRLTLFFRGETDQPEELEKALHHEFRAKRRGYEWFDLNQADLDMIAAVVPGWTKEQWDQRRFKMIPSDFEKKWAGFNPLWFRQKYPDYFHPSTLTE